MFSIRRSSASLLYRPAQINSLRANWSHVSRRFSSIAPDYAKSGGYSTPRWTATRALLLSGLTGVCVYSFATWNNNPYKIAATSSTELPGTMPVYGNSKDMQTVCGSALCMQDMVHRITLTQ